MGFDLKNTTNIQTIVSQMQCIYFVSTQVMVNLAGRDVTDVFHGMHPDYVYSRLPAFHIGNLKNYEESESTKAYRQLELEIEREGLYKTRYSYYVMKIIISFLMLAIAVSCYVQGYYNNWTSLQILGSLILGMYFWQTAFIGHDAGHNGITHVRIYDHLIGVLVGPIMTGISIGEYQLTH